MSNSPLVIYTKISPNRSSPRNHVIDTIAIHCMAGHLSLRACGDLFAKSSTGASSNYGINDDGEVGLFVDERDRSWCTSSRDVDNRAVTIEVASDASGACKVTDAALASTIKLCADICKRNGIKKLVWSDSKNDRVNHLNGCNMEVHRDHDTKACPGDYLMSKMQYIADESQNADDDDDGSEEESVDQESSRNPGPKQRDQRWPLTGEVLEVISTIQNTDDPQLTEWAYLLAHESLRYWFIRMAKKYGYARNQEARQDFFSAAEEVFAAGLPKYRADKGMLTTYFEPRIKKALGEEQRKHSCKNSTRHYESQWQTIEKCKALLAQQGIIDPNPRQISAYASLELKIDNISEQAIINCLEQARTQVAMDENIGYNISEDMENPETQYLQKEKIARLYKVIEKMPPLQKLLLTLRLQAIRETDKDMTTNELVRAAQKHIPGITLNEVRRANSAASLAVEKAFTNGYYHEKVILNGVTVSTENLEADAKEICEIVDTIDDFFEPM